MIKLTIGLPVFNSKDIAWLAMEGLCRQKKIDFEWELLIAEEESANFSGKDFFKEYSERLKLVGCKNLTYFFLDKWIPLSQKWKKLGEEANKDSVCFLLQAVDCYSQPYRLKDSFETICAGYDWYKANKGLFYYIQTEQHILFSDKENKQRGGLNMSARTDCMRNLPLSDRASCVDGWLVKNINPQKVFVDDSNNWKFGVDTHGYNNISKKRSKFFNKIEFPFVETDLRIDNLLPKDIVERLKLMK